MSEQDTITIEPLISYPREVLIGKPYLMTIDLRIADSQHEWPYDEEEYQVWFILDTMPLFSHISITSPSVVLRRVGGTYGPAKFVLTALQEAPHGEAGEIDILIVNKHGLPLEQITVISRIKSEGAIPPIEIVSASRPAKNQQPAPEITSQLADDINTKRPAPEIAHVGDVEFAKLDVAYLQPIRTLTQVFDHHWLPKTLLSKAFHAGAITENIDQELRRTIRAGYIHSLLHSQQVIVNRAHLYDNAVVSQDYIQSVGTNREAFKTLLAEGTIVPYLLNAQTPVDPPTGVKGTNAFKAWQEICQEIRTNCIRLSWDERENDYLKDSYLKERFSTLVLTASIRDTDTYLRDFKLDDRYRDGLHSRLIEVGRFCQDVLDKGQVPTRNQLYKRFVIAGGNPAERHYDSSKPFAFEIKQLLDLAFNCNLPDALDSYLITPFDTLPRTALQEWQPTFTLPVITGEGLVKLLQRLAFSLVGDFSNIPSLDALSLNDVRQVRRMDEWSTYMQSLQDLLRDPLRFAEGEAFNVYTSYSKLARQITDIIARQDRRYNPLTTWSPVVELTFSAPGATLSYTQTASDPLYRLFGHVSETLTDRNVPVAGRLIIRDATQIMRDTTEIGIQQDLGTSLDFGRFTMQDITRQWKEIERQVKKLSGYRDTADSQQTAQHGEANMSYRELVSV